MQSNTCGVPMYVSGDSDFKYAITWLLWHLFPPFVKMGVVNTNIPISQKLRHLLLILLVCWYIIEMFSINEATLAYCKQIPHYYFSFGIVMTVGIYLIGNYHLV